MKGVAAITAPAIFFKLKSSSNTIAGLGRFASFTVLTDWLACQSEVRIGRRATSNQLEVRIGRRVTSNQLEVWIGRRATSNQLEVWIGRRATSNQLEVAWGAHDP